MVLTDMNDAQPDHVELDGSAHIGQQYDVQLGFLLVKERREVGWELGVEQIVQPYDRARDQRDERVHPEQLLERPLLTKVAEQTTTEVVVFHALLYQLRIRHVED